MSWACSEHVNIKAHLSETEMGFLIIRRVTKMLYEVRAALSEETSYPHVWLGGEPLPLRSIILIKNRANGKKVTCEYRKVEPNFIKKYNSNKSRVSINENQPTIVIAEWYRDILGIKTRTLVDLDISRICFFSQTRMSLKHPDNVMRYAAKLARLSIYLGAIGVLLGLVGIWLAKNQTHC